MKIVVLLLTATRYFLKSSIVGIPIVKFEYYLIGYPVEKREGQTLIFNNLVDATN